jgi:hypothetical protein
MELLPAMLPTLGHGLRARLRERAADRGGAGGVRVDGELGFGIELALLEARRRVGYEPGTSDLRLGGRDDEPDPEESAQRSALFRRPKKPPSSSRDR